MDAAGAINHRQRAGERVTSAEKLPDRTANNIGMLRLIAACGVMVFHITVLVGRPQHLTGTELVTLGSLAVSVFFALSGFLLVHSILRDNDPKNYLVRRFLRIFPGYAVCALFVYFVIQPVFADRGTPTFDARSLLSLISSLTIFGWEATAHLPGLFERNPNPVVNGSLWSLPYEVVCYLLLILAFHLFKSFKAGLVITFAVLFWMCVYAILPHVEILDGITTTLLSSYGACFFFASILAAFNARGNLYLDLIAVCSIIGAALITHPPEWRPFFVASTFAVPYLTIRIAYIPWTPLSTLTSRYDLSYGVYLYSFPITQCVVALIGPDSTISVLASTAALTFVAAALSWTYVEKPALRLGSRR